MVTKCGLPAPVLKPSNLIRYAIESPSSQCALDAPALPFTQAPPAHGTGGAPTPPFLHWSMSAEAFEDAAAKMPIFFGDRRDSLVEGVNDPLVETAGVSATSAANSSLVLTAAVPEWPPEIIT